MQLFYAPDFEPPLFTLGEEESAHCLRVLRLGCGDTVHITDGRGNLYGCEIVEARPRACTVRVVTTAAEYGRRPYRLELAVAPTKNNDRYEWLLEKATEVGVDAVVPLLCARSERRIFKRERGEKIIVAAMKQSLKAYCPQLHELTPFEAFVRTPFDGRRFIAHCDAPQSEAGRRFLPAAVAKSENMRILIGPEGDFSPEEITFALANGYEEISLGDQRLRTETAAVVAAVMAATVNAL